MPFGMGGNSYKKKPQPRPINIPSGMTGEQLDPGMMLPTPPGFNLQNIISALGSNGFLPQSQGQVPITGPNHIDIPESFKGNLRAARENQQAQLEDQQEPVSKMPKKSAGAAATAAGLGLTGLAGYEA